MSLSAPGIGSNLDVNGIVTRLMDAERRPVKALDVREAGLQTEITAFGTLKSSLATFQTAAQALNDASRFQAMSATPSDSDVLRASASSTAAPGTHTVEVTQLAQAQKLAAAGQSSTSTAIGSGTLTFDFGTIADPGATFNATTGKYGAGATFTSDGSASKTVVIGSTGNTLDGIRDAINNANIGVTASIVNDGSGAPYRLALSVNDSGAAHSVKISVSGDTALSNLLSHDPTGAQALFETVTARNALLKVDGIAVSRSTNAAENTIPGLTLNLYKTGTSTVDIARDSSTVKASVETLVNAYNALNKNLSELTAYNATTKKGGVLLGNAAVRTIQTQLRAALSAPISGLSGSLTSLTDVGIGFQKDGTLALDSATFNTAITAHFDDIAAIFAAVGKPSDSQISFVAASPGTEPGAYAVNVTALASSGGSAAGSIGGIGADGSDQLLTAGPGSGAQGLQIRINGGATGDRGTITFTQGYAFRLDRVIESFLSPSGALAASTEDLGKGVKDIANRRAAMNQRLESVERRYRAQFAALDQLMSNMQSTSNFLLQQLNNTPKK